MVAKTKGGEVVSFPVTETIHKDSILHVTQTPAQIPEELLEKAKELAEQAVASLEGKQKFDMLSVYPTEFDCRSKSLLRTLFQTMN